MGHGPSDSFLSGLHFICEALVPQLVFLNARKKQSLEVARLDRKVRFLKLELVNERSFHLERIRIFAKVNEQTVDIAPQAQLRISSIWGDTEWLVASRAFLNGERGNRPYGFHTRREQRPWVIVDLGEPVFLERIQICNRSDHCAHRSLPLVVSASVDGEKWSTLYNHAQIIDGLRKALDQLVGQRAPEPEAHSASLLALDLMWSWYLGDVPEVDRIWTTYCRSAPKTKCQREVVHYFNENILRKHEKELTIHGITKSFRFWSDKEKQTYVKFANAVMDTLRPLSAHICLGYGSVLGIVREHDLLPHDNDIDVLIALPSTPPAKLSDHVHNVEDFLKSHGFDVASYESDASKKFLSHRWVSDGENKLDVFVGIIEEPYVSFYPGHRRRMKLDDIFPAIEVRIHDVETILPRNPFRYLEQVYGNDWNIPSASWQHSWDISEFRDVL
jgi:hypothetical protein